MSGICGLFNLDGKPVSEHEIASMTAMLVRIRIRQTHEDGNLTVGMPDTGAPPLATIQNHFVAFNNGRGRQVVRVGRGHKDHL